MGYVLYGECCRVHDEDVGLFFVFFFVFVFLFFVFCFFFFNDTATTEIYTLSLPRRSSDLTTVCKDTRYSGIPPIHGR